MSGSRLRTSSPIVAAADPKSPAALSAAIRDRALALGFDAIGFAPASLDAAVRERLGAFLALGRHGDMGWLADRAELRGDPTNLWSEARSVIALGTNYAPHEDPRLLQAFPERGLISAYARNRDYHDLIKGRLKTLGQWMAHKTGLPLKVFVDTAPVMEKPLSQRAGLGWQGKHTNLVSREFGSWLFLGVIYTPLDLAPTGVEHDHCGACQRCLDACPTNAFPAPYQLDARRCISYLTIELKGVIPNEFKPLIGNRIYGCDDCLAACPWNKFAKTSREVAFMPRVELLAPELGDLVQLDDPTFRQIFSGSPIKRIGRDRFVRNALVALGNSGEGKLAPLAAGLIDDPDHGVADAASWAYRRLMALKD